MAVNSHKVKLIFVMLAILLVSINLRPAISSIGPVLDSIRIDLDLTNSQVSLLTAVPVFCMGLFAPFAVTFNKMFGIRNSIVILLMIIGVFTFFRGLYPSYPVLLISSFLIGLAIAIISPLLSALIKRDFPRRTVPLIGLFSFGMGLGAALSAGLTGVFYTYFSWPWALGIWGLLAVAALFAWLIIIPSKEEKPNLKMPGDVSVSPWKNPLAWYMLLFFAFQSAFFFSLITWLAPIAIDRGMSVLEAGAVLTVMTVVQIFGNILFPFLLSKYPNRLMWILIVSGFGALGILFLMAGGTALIWLASICLGITLGGLFPIALLMPLDATDSAEDTNSWTAMIQSGGYVISGCTPFLIGVLYDRFESHNITLAMFLIFIALITIFAVMISKQQKKLR